MFIIIEGPDGAGKTTLAEQLASQSGFEIVHFDKPKTQEEKDNMYEMYLNSIKKGGNKILDRCWYSEIVYGPIMRDRSYISLEQMEALEEAVALNGGGIVIFCSNSTATLWDRCLSRGENYILSVDKIAEIRLVYNCLMELNHKLPIVRYTI